MRIHVFIGTKAQYIKTAPLLRLMDARGVAYRLIDSGQHARLGTGLRRELRVRDPDHSLGRGSDIESIPQAVAWAARLSLRLWSGRRLRRDVFGGEGGVCVVHGDTPSTLLATLFARRAGLRVAHLEGGLRSFDWLNPFPEELIRILVMRMAHIIFAPDAAAERNLARMGLAERTVPLSGNTSLEALEYSLERGHESGDPAAVITMHRVENLNDRARVDGLLRMADRIAARWPTTFVLHGPTRELFTRRGLDDPLAAAGVRLLPLVEHGRFTAMLAAAPLVVTDGGSIQEECALLGVPTLLWRKATERPDGLDANVVLSEYDPEVVDAFLADPERFRRPRAAPRGRPSQQVLDVLGNEVVPCR